MSRYTKKLEYVTITVGYDPFMRTFYAHVKNNGALATPVLLLGQIYDEHTDLSRFAAALWETGYTLGNAMVVRIGCEQLGVECPAALPEGWTDDNEGNETIYRVG